MYDTHANKKNAVVVLWCYNAIHFFYIFKQNTFMYSILIFFQENNLILFELSNIFSQIKQNSTSCVYEK